MSSILTNMSAMSAIANLSATQKNLANTENQISTGLRVAAAKDNAAYWSIATSMKTTTGDLSAVADSLNLGSSVVGTATAALNTTISIMQKMKADLVSAAQSGTDAGKIQTDIDALKNQLTTTIGSASFNGVNLLNQTSSAVSTQSIVSSVNGSGTTFQINTITVSYSDTALKTYNSTGILDSTATQSGQSILSLSITAPPLTAGQLQTLAQDVDLALVKIQTAAAKLGATQTNIDLQSTFVQALSDSITTGVGSLIDADMNQASTRLNALQTQQQLGIQALSVSNQNSQIILKLFNG